MQSLLLVEEGALSSTVTEIIIIIRPFVTAWPDPEVTALTEISRTDRTRSHRTSLMWDIKPKATK